MAADVSVHLFNMRAYKEKVLPAYQTFFSTDNAEPIIGLLRDCIQKLDANPQLSDQLLWDRESGEEDIAILNGTVYHSPDDGKSSNQGETKTAIKVRREYARELLSSKILQILCVPHDKGVSAEQDMTNTRLIPYLYEKSEWIKDLFTFTRKVRGSQMEFAIGEFSELFTKEDVQDFNTELNKVPPPEDIQLRRVYDNLRALLRLALENPDLTLVLSVR